MPARMEDELGPRRLNPRLKKTKNEYRTNWRLIERGHVKKNYSDGSYVYKDFNPKNGNITSFMYNNGEYVFFKNFVHKFWFYQNLASGIRVITFKDNLKHVMKFKPGPKAKKM